MKILAVGDIHLGRTPSRLHPELASQARRFGPAVAPVFLDRAADLAAKLGCDGEAPVRALRVGKLKHFLQSKTDELEKWLATRVE